MYYFCSMAKVKKAWFCTECGNESAKWMGKCPACGAWNTMTEEIIPAKGQDTTPSGRVRSLLDHGKAVPLALKDIDLTEQGRIAIGNAEVERVLGGGLVRGSMILIGGEPGIGKSTLSLQIPLHCPDLRTLYVSGEESPRQIRLRADRLSPGGTAENCLILGETLVENILQQAREIRPELLVIDSIQTIYSEAMESSPGSVSQIRECAALLLRFAKETDTPVILIGHITKDGTLAGPKVLEHIVDVVLQFEGDTRHAYRILRSIKNRFGSTAELAIFEMRQNGLREVSNPSEMLMPSHAESLSGIAVSAMLDGTRPFLVEIQALVSTAAYGTPQRSATGFDSRRLNMLLAVLEKRAGFKLSAKDVFLNIAGGLKISDPACDLAVVCAILSSNFDHALSPKTAFAAEIGLSGEIRPVNQIEQRIAEARRLGFQTIFISSYNLTPETDRSRFRGIRIEEVRDIPELCRTLFR